MIQWVNRGIRTGIKTTIYPTSPENAAGVTPGLPQGGTHSPEEVQALVEGCPTHAISGQYDQVSIDYRRCVHCFRCHPQLSETLGWSQDYEWAGANETRDPRRTFGKEFNRSAHILVVDAGDCGACLNEVKQLNNPYYNMHRLGFFFTPTPRHADILVVVGPVTDHMRVALQKTYEAMPHPKKVVGVGACALSGKQTAGEGSGLEMSEVMDLRHFGVVTQVICHDPRISIGLFHAQTQCFQRSTEHPARMRVELSTDRASQRLDAFHENF